MATKNRNKSVSVTTNTGSKTPAQILTRVSDYDKVLPSTYTQNYRRIRELRRDPTIYLVRKLCMAPIIAADWAIGSDDQAPEGARELIESAMIPQRSHIMRTALSGMIDFGWQPYEKVFKRTEDGAIIISKLKPLLQDYTDPLVDPKTGDLLGLYNCINNVEVRLNIAEIMLFSLDVEGTDWRGSAIMDNVDKAQRDWEAVNRVASRYDRKIAGAHWMVYYPDGMSEYNGTLTAHWIIAQNLLRDLEGSGSTAIPRSVADITAELNGKGDEVGWKIEILSAYPTSGVAFIDRMKYIDVLKVRAFGMPERAMTEGQFGTKAEAGEHIDLANTSAQNQLDLMVQEINAHMINQMLRLNYGEETEDTVWIEASPIKDEAIAYLRDIYKQLITNPDGFAFEAANVDFDTLRNRVDIPTDPSALEGREETPETETEGNVDDGQTD